MNFLRKKFAILILIVLLLVLMGGFVWFSWTRDHFESRSEKQDILSRVSRLDLGGYKRKDTIQASPNVVDYFLQSEYSPVSGHNDEDIKRVVGSIVVTIIGYKTSQEAGRVVEEAGVAYFWDWREEKIGEQKIYTGYLLDLDRTVYTEAYIAWVEGNAYFEVVARPDSYGFKDFSDKKFLYQAAYEVAEKLLGEAQQ